MVKNLANSLNRSELTGKKIHLSNQFLVCSLYLKQLPVEVEKVSNESHQNVSEGVVVLAQRSGYQPGGKRTFVKRKFVKRTFVKRTFVKRTFVKRTFVRRTFVKRTASYSI